MKRNRWNPRKLLIASAGVATVNYALATGCESRSSVANLMVSPGGVGSGGTAGDRLPPEIPPAQPPGPGPTVANLVAPPPPVGVDAGQFPGFELPDAAPPDASSDDAGPPDAAS
jgi:hypothetical protein